MVKISCIIPTYNEEARITGVLNVISTHPLIDEVIVVDDGSKDNTRSIVSRFPNVHLIIHEKNQGKSKAIYTGIRASQGEFLLFVDADLVGLNADNITSLITPILDNVADVSISLRRNAPKMWHRVGIDYISGERVFRKETIAKHLEDIPTLPKFGLEVFFNRWIIKGKCRIKIVPWDNVDSPYKYKKYGWYVGIREDIKMTLDILETVSIIGPIYQIIQMLKLRV